MSSDRRSNNGGVAGVQSMTPATRKIVQSLKEIVNCPEPEIYSALKDCNMDPNEAVNRLLSQDPFHEVKSKREKKKENKDLPETKFRVGSSTSNRGSRSDRGRGGSAQFSSSDFSASQGKLAYKKENGTNSYTTSLSVPQVAVDNTSWRPSAFSNSVTMENETSKRSVVEGMSASQTDSGYQSAWVGVPGQKSLADIVKTGRPQSNAASSLKSSQSSANHCFDHAPKSTEFYHDLSSENQHSEVTDQYGKQGAAPDEWPLIEPPENANLSSVLESHTESQLHPDRSALPSDKNSQHLHSEKDEFEEESSKNRDDYHLGSATISSRTQEIKSGDASLYGNGMYTKLGPYRSYNCAFQNEEVEDGVATSVLSETANLKHLSIQEEERKPSYEEDGPSVVIPDHLQVQSADCSHLSFGSFRSGLAAGFSGSRSSRNNMEETPLVADASVIRETDVRKEEYYGEEAFLTATDENLAYRATGVAGTFDLASASQSDFLKQQYPEAAARGSQYTFTPASTGYPFEKAQQQNIAFSYAQTSSRLPNIASFSDSMVYTNPLSSTLLAANVPVRDSEFSYSPFSVAQSVAPKYGNTMSSIGGSSISMEEALKTGLQSLHLTQQHLSGKRVASEQSVPQHLAAHQNSQPTHPLGPFANMNDYTYLPQNDTYKPSAFQQAFTGNGTYHQSLADVLPRYKNSVSVSSFPQSAAVPSGYRNFGNSTTSSGNYAMNPPVVPAGSTIGYDDLLSTRFKDNSHLIPLQQNENSAMWLHGHGSRTMSAVPASAYYSLQGQNQHPGGFRQGQQSSLNYGDTDFYNSQMGMPLEQQLQNPRNGSLSGSYVQSKQPQQIWQNSY